MIKAAFVGFGEVNTPKEIIVKKCADAEAGLKKEGMELISVFPITDDYAQKDIKLAVDTLRGKDFDVLMVVMRAKLLPQARDVVKQVDDKAFMIVTNATSVFGEGFKRHDAEEI